MYRAFVRPRLESGSLARMGAAQTNLKRLDRVQEAAALIIGAEADTLWTLLYTDAEVVHWRTCTSFSHGMHPKNCGRGFRRNWKGRRAAALECLRESTTLRTRINFSRCLPVSAPITSREDFFFCIIEDWNILPANFFTDGFDIAHLQSLKCKVNNFLRSQPTPLRGEAA